MNSIKSNPAKLLRYRDSIYAVDLLVCAVAQLDLFNYLKKSPKSFEQICNDLDTTSRPTDVMLSLFLAMELLKKTDNEYGLTEISRQYFVSDSVDSLVPYYASLKNRPQCQEFLEVLKSGKLAGWSSKEDGISWIEAMRDERFAGEFTAAMDSRGHYLAQILADKIDFSCYRSILDVAGGSGIYACSIIRRFPHLKAAILEISPVDAATRRSIENKEMANKVEVITGDMFDSLPNVFDLHLFANTMHDWGIDSVRKLLKTSYLSLPFGGSIMIFDAHLNADKNGPLSVAEYSCLLMHSTEGRCYSTQEISAWLIEAGFQQITITDIAADRSVVSGRKK